MLVEKSSRRFILLIIFFEKFISNLYIFIIPKLTEVFLPQHNYQNGLTILYAILTTSLLTKPLGAYTAHLLANKFDIKNIFLYSVCISAFVNIIISIIPNHENIGNLSLVMLLISKIIQSISNSIALTLSMLYIVDNKEHSISRTHSFIYENISLIAIYCVSLISLLIFSIKILYLWRFFFGVSGIVVLIITMRSNQFDIYLKPSTNNTKKNFIQLLREYKIHILLIMFVTNYTYLTYYIPMVIMNDFVPLVTAVSNQNMQLMNNIIIGCEILLIPIIGKFLIRYQAHSILLIASLILTISIFPLWIHLYKAPLLYVIFVRIFIVFWGIVFLCPLNYWYNNLLKNNKYKYFIVGMGIALGSGIFGKSIPFIHSVIFYNTNNILYCSLYLFLMFLSSNIAIVAASRYFKNK